MRWWGVLAAVAAIGLCGASQPPAQQSEPTEAVKQEANDDRGTGSDPLYVKVVPAPKTQTEAAEEKRENTRKADLERKSLTTNIVLALFAFGQFVVTVITLRGLKHAETAAIAADKAADASLRAAEIASDTAQRQLRAYVTVKIGPLTGVGDNQQPTGNIELVNVGQTPAHNVSTKVVVSIAELGSTSNVTDHDEVERGHRVVGPGHPTFSHSRATFALTKEGLAAIRARQALIVVSGCVVYEDIFERTQWTQFCHLYSGPDLNGWYHDQLNRAT